MKGCIAMARFENEFSRSDQMTWGEGNGHRGQPAYGRFGAPGEYGWGSGEGPGAFAGQGCGAMGELSGRGFVGPGSDWPDFGDQGYARQGYGRQGIGWQQGPPSAYGTGRGMGWQQRSFVAPDVGDEGQYGGWRGPGFGGYGPTGRMMSDEYGPRGFESPGWSPQQVPSGYWAQRRGDWEAAPREATLWEQGQLGGWGEGSFGGAEYGPRRREMMGAMGTFPEGWTAGPYTGRGPRGYRRSDARIEEDVNERLTRHPLLDASDIEVRVQGGEVTLMGMVDSRRAKRLAKDIIEPISGVQDVSNQLRVQHDEERLGQQGGQAGATTRGQAQSQARAQAPRTPVTKTPASTTAA
jgi:hypothetical protein